MKKKGNGYLKVARLYEKGKADVAQLQAEVEAALKLSSQEQADAIIVEPGEEYGVLVRGVRAAHAMMFGMFQVYGLKRNDLSLRAGAQGLSMVLTMLHYAYALGIERGKQYEREGKS